MGRRRNPLPLPVRFRNIAALMEMSVAEGTTIRYSVAVKKHIKLGYTADYDGLVERAQQAAPVSSYELRAARSAIQAHLRGQGLLEMPPYQVKLLTRLFLGRARATKEGVTSRGAITGDLLTFLLDTLRAAPYNIGLDVERSILLCWCCALRTSQMPKVCPNDFTLEDDGNITLRLTKIHDPTLAARGGVPRVEVRTVAKRGLGVLRLFLRGALNKKEPLFPKGVWMPTRVNKWVKEIARANPDRFDPDLEWDGAHCFRHGIAAETLSKTGKIAEVVKVTGHRSEWMAGKYARTNATRKAQVNKSKTAKKATLKLAVSTKKR